MKKYYWITSKLYEVLNETDWKLEKWRLEDQLFDSLDECVNEVTWQALYVADFPKEWTWMVFSFENWDEPHTLEKEFRAIYENYTLEEVE